MCFVCAFGEPPRNLPQRAEKVNYDEKKGAVRAFSLTAIKLSQSLKILAVQSLRPTFHFHLVKGLLKLVNHRAWH